MLLLLRLQRTRDLRAFLADPAHPPAMSLPTRVKSGVPAGGQFAAISKSESNLTLLAGDPALSPVVAIEEHRDPLTSRIALGPVPDFPDRLEFARLYPNRAQRSDRINERLFAVAAHPRCPAPERIGAARLAVTDTLVFYGRFVSLPEDDGEAVSLVATALNDEDKVLEAVARVGHLEDFEARSFGNRIAGALYDIEIDARETQTSHKASLLADLDTPEWADDEAPPVVDFS